MKPKLLIFGASVRAVVQSARGAGYVVEAYDLFADHDTRAACETDRNRSSSVTQIDSFDQIPDLVSSRTTAGRCREFEVAITCGGVAEHADAMAAISRHLTIAGASFETIASLATNRQARFDVYEASGCMVAPTVGELPDDANPSDWLLKPCLGSGGLTIRTARPCDIPYELASSQQIFQRRIEGKSYSAVYATKHKKTQMIGATQQRVGDPRLTDLPFAYCGSIGPIKLPAAANSIVATLGTQLARRFDLQGVFGVDFLLNQDGVWPVDVNARITSSAEIFEAFDFATQRQPAFNVIEAQLGKSQLSKIATEQTNTAELVCGKAIVFNQGKRNLHVGGDVLTRLIDLNQSNRCVSDIPNAGVTIDAGAPMVTVHAVAENHAAVEDKLFALADRVRRCWA